MPACGPDEVVKHGVIAHLLSGLGHAGETQALMMNRTVLLNFLLFDLNPAFYSSVETVTPPADTPNGILVLAAKMII